MCRQVLTMLGCVEGARIVELGAGIGRFTGELAVAARSVLAVDFMENLIAENRRANSHRCVRRAPSYFAHSLLSDGCLPCMYLHLQLSAPLQIHSPMTSRWPCTTWSWRGGSLAVL